MSVGLATGKGWLQHEGHVQTCCSHGEQGLRPCLRRVGSSPGSQQGPAQPFPLSLMLLLGLVSPFFWVS